MSQGRTECAPTCSLRFKPFRIGHNQHGITMRCTRSRTCVCLFLLARFPFRLGDRCRYAALVLTASFWQTKTMELQRTGAIETTRILLSVICIVVFVLLSLLWVRSYWWIDNVTGPQSGDYRPQLGSSNGWLTVRYRNDKLSPDQIPEWNRQSKTHAEMDAIYEQMEKSIANEPGATFVRPTPMYHFGWTGVATFRTPYWIPVFVSAGLAVLFGWKQDWRFSISTMLFAFAAGAVVLALIVKFLRM